MSIDALQVYPVLFHVTSPGDKYSALRIIVYALISDGVNLHPYWQVPPCLLPEAESRP
jgi:hypothetical protein